MCFCVGVSFKDFFIAFFVLFNFLADKSFTSLVVFLYLCITVFLKETPAVSVFAATCY